MGPMGSSNLAPGFLKQASTPEELTSALEGLNRGPALESANRGPALEGSDRASVLVIDDDRVLTQTLKEILEHQGYRVEEAANGAAGLSAFSRTPADLILLDVVMPRLDGFGVCRELRKMAAGAHVPVLMMTGLDDEESVNRAFEAGATDFITKPLNWGLLVHRVRYVLRAGRAFEELSLSRAELAHAQRISHLGSWSWDPETGAINWSEEVYRIFGLSPTAFSPAYHSFIEAIHPDHRKRVETALHAAMHEDEPFDLDYPIVLQTGTQRILHAQAEVIRDADRRTIRVRGTVQDITEKKRAQEQIRYLAFRDSLTDLPNRRLFRERLDRAITRAKRNQRRVASLFLDLDQFKQVNDTFGHAGGDQLLQEVAKRLKRCIRHDDVITQFLTEQVNSSVARLGGDEFIILLSEIAHTEDAARIARRVLDSLREPVSLGAEQVLVSASIGIALYPDDGDNVDLLLRNADAAMYQAKAQGRNNYQFYRESIHAAAIKKLSMESSLRKALAREEFVLYYQPQVNTATEAIVGLEALIRWRHPELGLIAPGEFIGTAEDTGLIVPIGEWVVRAACNQSMAWQKAGLPLARVSVNLSALNFKQKSLIATIARALKESGIDPQNLELEVTESALMQDSEATLATLTQLKEMGVRLSIDDFGTGYSSLSYLRRFPIDTLKIDQAFVNEATTDRSAAMLTRAIIQLAQNLDLNVIAEGVETKEQLAFLRLHRCNEAQGYLFSPPQQEQSIAEMLRSAKPLQ